MNQVINLIFIFSVLTSLFSCGQTSIPESNPSSLKDSSDLFLMKKNEHFKILPNFKIEKLKESVLSLESGSGPKTVRAHKLQSLPQTELQSNNYLRLKTLRLIYRHIRGYDIKSQNLINLFDSNIYPINTWSFYNFNYFHEQIKNIASKSFIPLGGNFKTKLKLNRSVDKSNIYISNLYTSINSLEEDHSLTHLKASEVYSSDLSDEFFKNSNSKNSNYLNLSFNHLNPTSIVDSLKNDRNLLLKIDDFTIHHQNGEEIKYSELKRNMISKTTRVIISTPTKTEEYFTNSYSTIKEMISGLDPKARFSQFGDLTFLYGLKSDVAETIDWNFIRSDQLDLNSWSILLQNNNTVKNIHLNESIKPNSTIIITYSDLRSILNASKNIRHVNFKTPTVIKNINPEDEIRLSIEGNKVVNKFINKTINASGFVENRIKQTSILIPIIQYLRDHFSNCGIINKSRNGQQTSNLIFSDAKIINLITLEINEKKFPLSLFQKKDSAILINNGKTLILKFKVPKEILKHTSDIKIQLLQQVDQGRVSLGFQGWGNCPYNTLRNFTLNSYRTSPIFFSNMLKYNYNIEVSVKSLDD